MQGATPGGIESFLQRIAAGDREAKLWLYENFAPGLERRIRGRFGADPQLDPQELLHDLFVWCFQDDAAILLAFLDRNPPQLRSEARLHGYLFGLVSGLVANRRRSRRRAPQLDAIAEMPIADPRDTATAREQRDSAERMLDCIRGRGSRLLAYFSLRFVEGLTPDEIVQVTGWEKSKTYALRASLKQAAQHCAEKLGLALALLVTFAGCEPPSPSWHAALEFEVRGHQELRDGDPLFIGEGKGPGICLSAPVDRDPTGWELALDGRRLEPSDQQGRFLCFDLELPTEPGRYEHCPRLDLPDGERVIELGCSALYVVAEDPLHTAFDALMRRRSELGAEKWLERIDAFAREAIESGRPLLALRARLIQSYFDRRSGEARRLDAARARLEAIEPSRLGRHVASWVAQHAYEKATLALDRDSLEQAWQELEIADRHYRRTLDRRRITVAMKQAEVLWQAGSPGHARRRLEAALERCEQAGCAERLVLAARNTQSWLTLQDPDASSEALLAVESVMQAALDAQDPASDPLEYANGAINLAYARSRLAGEVEPILRRALDALSTSEREPERQRWLRDWSVVIRAQAELAGDRPERAAKLCGEIAERGRDPELSIWAWSCLARARYRQGALARSFEAIEHARLLHALSDDDPLDRQTPIGPGQRARDSFFAARVAIESGRADAAWTILEQLDGRPGEACEETATDWGQLLDDLVALGRPASRPLRAVRADSRFELSAAAQRRVRRQWACTLGRSDEALRSPWPELRAFVEADELFVLHRAVDGEATLVSRRAFGKGRLRPLLGAIEAALISRGTSDARWAELVAPFAETLVPPTDTFTERTVVALHGPLQQLPYATLPLTDGPGIVADHTLVLHRPAGAWRRSTVSNGEGTTLFVVDPQRNLAGSELSARDYRRLARSKVLFGAEATRSAVNAALPTASGLHVDAHARFDPLFPELTGVMMADGELPAATWADSAATFRFVNLSVCGAARWPMTADSGRFGVAGLLARSGARWVVAARHDLPNEVAQSFNERFYAEIDRGRAPAEAYRRALDEVRSAFKSVDWAPLVLISASIDAVGSRIAAVPDSTQARSDP